MDVKLKQKRIRKYKPKKPKEPKQPKEKKDKSPKEPKEKKEKSPKEPRPPKVKPRPPPLKIVMRKFEPENIKIFCPFTPTPSPPHLKTPVSFGSGYSII